MRGSSSFRDDAIFWVGGALLSFLILVQMRELKEEDKSKNEELNTVLEESLM